MTSAVERTNDRDSRVARATSHDGITRGEDAGGGRARVAAGAAGAEARVLGGDSVRVGLPAADALF